MAHVDLANVTLCYNGGVELILYIYYYYYYYYHYLLYGGYLYIYS
jgi:hypothetical protein